VLPQWTSNDVLVDGVRLHYCRTGHGEKRPLVLVHGFSDNGSLWARTARDLESHYDVIMPHMRGHGLSARVQPTDNVDMAADLAGLIRALGLRRPIIGGHSMGAMIAYKIGVRFPAMAGALILEDPPWWLPRPNWTAEAGQPAERPIAKWARDLSSQTYEQLLEQYRDEHPKWPEEMVRLMCESKKQLDPAIVDAAVEGVEAEASDWLTHIANITQPTLLITGNADLGAIVTPEVVAMIRHLNPGISVVNVSDVGHLVRFDNYAAFMEAVRAFLKQIPS
jgi:N-formylmaleamate deformylase